MSQTEYVTLSSNDDYRFVIRRSATSINATIRSMLDVDRGFSESITNECRFENMSGDVLEVIAQYLCHAEKYKDVKDPPILDVPLDVVLDVLLAAEYLDL